MSTRMLDETDSNETSANGHEPESQEQLQAVKLNLEAMHRGDGTLVTLTKQDLGLLQTILRSATEEYKEQAMWRMVDFMDEEQALDHVAAYYEARELGMDTGFNVAYAFALCSVNRKGPRTNLIAQITDTLQHGKWAPTNSKGKNNGYANPRSPLSS